MFSLITSILSNLFLYLWLLGVLYVWWATSKKKRRAQALGTVLLVALWFLATRPVADLIIRPLENHYVPPTISSLQEQGIRQVVVLTGGGFPVRGEMLTSTFPHASMYRFLAGLELCNRMGPDCRLIFSGAAGRNRRDVTTAITMKDLAMALMPQHEFRAEGLSGSTEEHPENVRPFVKDEPFVLVTSALHMPRAMRVFRKAGLDPVPYPVDFLTIGYSGWTGWLPSVDNLWSVNVALREYLAIVFYMVRGW